MTGEYSAVLPCCGCGLDQGAEHVRRQVARTKAVFYGGLGGDQTFARRLCLGLQIKDA